MGPERLNTYSRTPTWLRRPTGLEPAASSYGRAEMRQPTLPGHVHDEHAVGGGVERPDVAAQVKTESNV